MLNLLSIDVKTLLLVSRVLNWNKSLNLMIPTLASHS